MSALSCRMNEVTLYSTTIQYKTNAHAMGCELLVVLASRKRRLVVLRATRRLGTWRTAVLALYYVYNTMCVYLYLMEQQRAAGSGLVSWTCELVQVGADQTGSQPWQHCIAQKGVTVMIIGEREMGIMENLAVSICHTQWQSCAPRIRCTVGLQFEESGGQASALTNG